MADIVFRSLPNLIFAHKYVAPNGYHNHLPKTNKVLEITVVTEGEMVAERDGICYVTQKGDVCCRYDADVHVSSSGYHSHHTVCFTIDLDEEKTSFVFPAVLHSPANSSTCLHLIDKIIQESIRNPENTLKLSGLFIQLIGEVEQAARISHIKASPAEIRYVDRAKKYIYEHISEPIAQNDIASFLEITPEYLCYIFKKCEGRSVIRFINETKLSRVKMLMESNQLSLRQASAQYGFSDPNYVSKLYKKYYNETITQAAKGSKK